MEQVTFKDYNCFKFYDNWIEIFNYSVIRKDPPKSELIDGFKIKVTFGCDVIEMNDYPQSAN